MSRFSLAYQHRMRAMAGLTATALVQASGAPSAPEACPAADDYALMILKLRTDLVQLKALQSVEKRIEMKRELLPGYAGWVQGRLDGAAVGGVGVQDDVLVTIMLWRVDVGDYAGALPLAEYALRFKLVMPEGYSRSVACLFAEDVSESALRDLAAGRPAPEILEQVAHLTAGRDMPDQVRAKIHKAIGFEVLRRAGDQATCAATGVPGAARIFKERALAELQRALALHDACGVKTEIKRLEKELNKPADAGEETAAQGNT